MYQIFQIPKRSGGMRTIEAPDPELKLLQQRMIYPLSQYYRISPFAHAFQPYKNIVTMAGNHTGKEYVGCLDIENFFPSISQANFLHYASTVIPNNPQLVAEINLEKCFHDFGAGPRLPQGAPTSPILSNIIMHKLDWTFAHLAFRYNCTYSRYADDLVFSGSDRKLIRGLFKASENYLSRMDFSINHKKTKIMHKSQRQIVCGIVVNEKINLSRKFRKNLRAEIFQQKGGVLPESTKGRIAFSRMVSEHHKDIRTSIEIIQTITLQKQLSK